MATTTSTTTATLVGSSDIYHFMKQQDLKTLEDRVFINKNGNPFLLFDRGADEIFVNFTKEAAEELRKSNGATVNAEFNEKFVIYYFSGEEENFVLCGHRKNSSTSISIEDMKR